MITILAIIVCGGLLVVGVICFIVALSSPKQKYQKPRKEEMAMVVSQYNQNFDLVTLPGEIVVQMPKEKKFDPSLVMMQLAEIQHAPNLISSYVCQLTARFRANNEIKFIRKIEEYQLALAGGFASQAEVLGKQLELERRKFELKTFTNPENQAIAEDVYRGDLEEKRARQRANTGHYENIQQKQKSNSPYDKSYNQTTKRIDDMRGRQDAIQALRQEEEGKIQYIKRGRDDGQLSDFEKEEILKIKKYYGAIHAQL